MSIVISFPNERLLFFASFLFDRFMKDMKEVGLIDEQIPPDAWYDYFMDKLDTNIRKMFYRYMRKTIARILNDSRKKPTIKIEIEYNQAYINLMRQLMLYVEENDKS